MLRNMNHLENCAIRATDGDLGHVKDFYFDDQAWVIRYLIVETGSWLSSRKVLISPMAVGKPDWDAKVLPVSITMAQVKDSPDIETDKPVSRQQEMTYLGYFNYPYYWGGSGLWGAGAYPASMLTGNAFSGTDDEYRRLQARQALEMRVSGPDQGDDDPHLRSCKEVLNYHIEATDGDIGRVHSLLVEEDTWAIRYLVVQTSGWWVDHQVLVVPQWIREMDWAENRVLVNLTRQQVKDAPPYDTAAKLDRDMEEGIYRHYGRNGYWADKPASRVPTSGRDLS